MAKCMSVGIFDRAWGRDNVSVRQAPGVNFTLVVIQTPRILQTFDEYLVHNNETSDNGTSVYTT